jgi:hypothetical protein
MKEPMPKMDLELSDVTDIQKLSKEELALVPFDKKKWQCCIESCKRFTNVKYYGPDTPAYWQGEWHDLTNRIFFCPIHWKLFKASGEKIEQFALKPGAGINHLV